MLPWVWADGSVDVVRFNHSLEHLGQEYKVLLGMMKKLYRICRNEAKVEINVPHPRHYNFIGDPTHAGVIAPQLLPLFDRRLNHKWKKPNAASTSLAHYLDVDLVVTKAMSVLAEPYSQLFHSEKTSAPYIEVIARESKNVVSEYGIEMVARK